MPQSIQTVSSRIANVFGNVIAAVALNKKATLPRVGTHLRNTDRVHGKTNVRVLKGFSRGLAGQATVSDLRNHVSCFIRIDGRMPSPSEILIFGWDKKTLHGRKLIS